jgi:hypothetical protein
MATKAKSSGQQAERQEGNATKAGTRRDEGTTAAVLPSQPAEAGGRRAATLNLPFVTAEFRAPDLHVPGRQELGNAAREARSMLPSRSSMLFYGGLAATAVVGVIEWPVAAAIGVGAALASRGAADPRPSGGSAQGAEVGRQSAGAGNGKNE